MCCQSAKREVRRFANKMMTGKEAWAEVQRMKETEADGGICLSTVYCLRCIVHL